MVCSKRHWLCIADWSLGKIGSLRHYKNLTGAKEYADGFTVDNGAVPMAGVVSLGSIATGDFILVSRDPARYPVFGSPSDRKAKVIEVRALDAEHAYLRGAWLYRPEELPCRCQNHPVTPNLCHQLCGRYPCPGCRCYLAHGTS